MNRIFDAKLFGLAVGFRRGRRGVRAIAGEAGVSAATVSRVERGGVPDMETFARLCIWMDVNAERFWNAPRAAKKPTRTETPRLL